LYSRTYFEIEIERLEASRLYPVTCFMCDVDYLKEVNDGLGHGAGDDLLRRAADLLRRCFRAEDIVARLGGDEFAVLVPSMDEVLADTVARRIREALEVERTTTPSPLLSISFGFDTVREAPLRRAIEAADRAMYAAKAARPGGPTTRRSHPDGYGSLR